MRIMLKTRPDGEYREIIREGRVTLEELAGEFRGELPYTVLLAKVNGKYEELSFSLEKDSTVELLDIRNHSADLAYQNSLALIYLKAVWDTMGDVPVNIENSLNKGLYTEIEVSPHVTEEQVRVVEKRMRELVAEDLPIVREIYDRQEAVEIWEQYNCSEKARLLRESTYITEAKFYSLEGYRNFFYGLMAPSTGYIKYFQLERYGQGVVMRFPQPSHPDSLPEPVDDRKIYRAFAEAKNWHRLLGVAYLPDLNDSIKAHKSKELVLLLSLIHI